MSVAALMRSLYRALRPGAKPHGVILMYHRVADCAIDPWSLCVSPSRFDEQLEAVKGSYEVLPVGELGRASSGRGAVSITFDDGYADNLHQAAPLLDRHDASACFFLTSGAIGDGREFWWDELERLLLHGGPLPGALEIGAGSDRCVLKPGNAAAPAGDVRAEIRARPPWKAASHTRLGFYYAAWKKLRTLGEQARRSALDGIAAQLDESTERRASHRTLTADEARQLATGPRREVGAHSVTHAVLPSLGRARQESEIRESKRQLERLVGRPIKGFAYPFGDHSPESAELVREAGFEFACTTEAGGVSAESDRFRLPRLGVEDWDGPQLLRRIEQIMG